VLGKGEGGVISQKSVLKYFYVIPLGKDLKECDLEIKLR